MPNKKSRELITCSFLLSLDRHESCDVWKTNKKGYKTQTQVKDTMRSMISTPVPVSAQVITEEMEAN